MSFLYRFAVSVGRKQPYIDWANGFGDGVELTEDTAGSNRTIYLVPETDGEPDRDQILNEAWESIFEEELAAWMLKEEDWPSTRTREMFDAWFDAEITSTVIDLAPDEPLTQAEVESIDLNAALHRCAWCDIELDDEDGHMIGFKISRRETLAHRHGLTVPITLTDDRVLLGVVPSEDSEAWTSGEDLMLRACSSRCERALRSAVPKALRKAFGSSRLSG